MLTIFYSFLSIGFLGILLGVGLAAVARFLALKKDERVSQIEALLPGANCGSCGFAGCAAYADAIINAQADPALCTPGGRAVADRIGAFLGVSVNYAGERKIAQICCRGSRKASAVKYRYQGLQDCNALKPIFNGDKVCSFGCLGLGSCQRVCPSGAIVRHQEGYLYVLRDLCIACGRCLKVCPVGVIRWVPYEADLFVACHSRDKGGEVRKYCEVGCIGCSICQKKSPQGGFVIENYLASIDYEQTGGREEALAACPRKCILPVAISEK
ncbi:MAG: RnfABCDGE type electron transport complex subunit B [Spirochaetales bacterium]|jgi:Na+-translocating ferredoxin:NAD+ oxidoreductase RNF subunit RnfB|nr:RnfABCDGE type electron transport complex subunit B [Spirochaetales bacterium]